MLKKACLLIIVILLLTPCVTAYTQTWTDTFVGTGSNRQLSYLRYVNVSQSYATKYITMSGLSYNNIITSGTYSNVIRNDLDTINMGNYTAVYSFTGTNYSAPYTMTITINDFDKGAATGSTSVILKDLKNAIGDPNSNVDGGGSSDEMAVYMVGFGAPLHSGYNGVQTAYGGTPANTTTFIISDSANFTMKLPNTAITLSNGQTGLTDAVGQLILTIEPQSDLYTYSLTKTGYTPKFMQALGGYGMTGGTVYNTLVAGNVTLPAGYTRTTVFAADGETGNTIVGATLNIKDVQNASWVNATSTATGTIIDVIDGHTLDIYGDYPGVYNASMELGATPGGNYYLPLFMYRAAPVGYVYLYVTARDAATGLAILNAPISTRLPTGAVEGSNSGSSGTASFLVPNNTIIVVSASPSGYNPISLSTTTTTVNKHVFVDMSRTIVPTATVAPVVTDPATGAVIPQTTYLPYCNPSAPDYSAAACSQSQDSDLMATLREWAPSLLILMILAWMFGLLKMIMKW